MKVLKKGGGAKAWSRTMTCSGYSNGGGGCGAKLLVEKPDLFYTCRCFMDGEEARYITFQWFDRNGFGHFVRGATHMMKDYKNRTHVELEQQIIEAASILGDLKTALNGLQSRCPHKWGKTEYTPEIHEGYQIPGDPPGTMGVDWRGPCWVPRQETARWTRICSECGVRQVTERTTNKVEKIPEFSDRRY